jgi:hypothetical protein
MRRLQNLREDTEEYKKRMAEESGKYAKLLEAK